MTENFAEKRAARAYAQAHGVPYRHALAAIRARRAAELEPFGRRVLIEAVEGCGIRHWAHVREWDGDGRACITDVGGESFHLDVDRMAAALNAHLEANPDLRPLDIDSYLADEIVQSALFGGVIYRSEVRRRPVMVA